MEKNNVFNVDIKIEKDEFEKAIEKAFQKKAKDIKVDGFRKGKVPFDVYVKKFGKESLYMDAVDIVLPNAYEKAIKKDNLIPIIAPKIDIKEINGDGVEFSFVITTKPEIKIKKYKDLKVSKDEVKVEQEEIDKEIANILKRYSELVIKTSGIVEDANVAIIDFEGFKDGVAFDGGKAENYALEIGSHTFIPGFEEQIIGMKKDEEKDIKVTFPEDYQSSDLAGKEVIFKVKVNEVKEKEERKLDKELFEDLAMEGVSTKEDLEKEIKTNLETNKEVEAENIYVDNLLKEIAKNTEVELPDELIDEEATRMIERFSEQMRMQGISLEVYYEITKSTEKDLREQMKEEAQNHVLYRFIIEEIKEKEKITITDKEVDEEAEKIAKGYNIEKDEFLKMYGGLDVIKYELEMQKTVDFLKENN